MSDLTFRPLPGVWDEVASDSGNCMGRNCPFFERCHYYAARRRVQNAQILVVNHALYFSDLALRRVGASILPEHDLVVFDEAHTLEAVAADHLGLGVTSGQVEYTLNKLYNDRTNKGLLVHHHCAEAQRQVLDCHHLSDVFFDDLGEWYQQRTSSNGRVRSAGIVENALSPALASLANSIDQAANQISDDSQRQDLAAARDRLLGLAGEIQTWLVQQLPEAVYWLEVSQTRRGRPRISLAAAPIDVGPALREQLFGRMRSVILTSATLSVGRQPSFDFFKTRVGLTQCKAQRLGSPFDFRRQARLIVVRDMPDPSSQKPDYERLCAP